MIGSIYICSVNEHEQHITQIIKKRILQKNPLAEVILFGSHARGKSTNSSDWDILILLDQTNVNRTMEREIRDLLFEVELEIGEPISTFVFSKKIWEQNHSVTPLYENIRREGIYL
ncbi:hypothetical protein EMGBS15_11120 [Filimonas sp.]|nr:hypothetical protein EMGBS15_11120 [Filimonas sp.]